MKLHDIKLLGGIGLIAGAFGGLIPSIGFLFSLAGIVLVFLAMSELSKITKDQSIFKNYLIYFILGIVGVFSFAIIFVVSLGFSALVGMMNYSQMMESMRSVEAILAILKSVLVAAIPLVALLIIGAVYLKKAYESAAKHTGVQMFATAGLLYLIAAATYIVLVGFIIAFVAEILAIVAFFSLPEELAEKAEESKTHLKNAPKRHKGDGQ